MKIGIVGTGALGSFYGAKLALAGNDVRFWLRSDYGAAMRDGIRVNQEGDALKVYPVNGYKTPDEIGPCDLVVVTAKTTANGTLPGDVLPMIGENSVLLTLQNGLGNVEQFQAALGKEKVLGGLCFVAATRRAPAVVDVFFSGSIRIGEPAGGLSPRAEKIAALFTEAGIPCRAVGHFEEAVWKKLVWNIPFSGLCVAANCPTDHILADAELKAQVITLMQEVCAVAAVHGCAIPESFLDEQIAATEKLGAYKPSALVDFEKRRPLEVDSIWGEPLRRARAHGVPVPQLELLHALVRHLSGSNKEVAN